MRLLLVSIFAFFAFSLSAQTDEFPTSESCTSIMSGKKATIDGSVITSHTCDGKYRSWLNIVPSADYLRDTTMNILWGTMQTETPWDTRGIEVKGKIDQAKHNYAYLNTAYPCLNEKQLAIGESTISGRSEMQNKKGLFLIENLEAIALQRCTTAREAIKLMGELVKQYGYADVGECLTIADPNEVWVFEIFGEGPDQIGAVWAAQRIPDDHVGVCANISRISQIDLSKPDYFMASENVFDVAKKMKLWDGAEPFKFWKAYSGAKPFQIREYFILSSFAPSLKLDYEAEELPFSVKPEKKVDVRYVMALLRSTFEGTPWDMTQNLKMIVQVKNDSGKMVNDTVTSPYANPWMRREMMGMLNYQNPKAVEFKRTDAVAWCAYSFVAQLRSNLPDEFGGIAWLSFDNPAESPRIPIFCGNLSLPASFNYSGQFNFNEQSAHWQYRQANRLGTVRWGDGRKLIEPALMQYEDKAFTELAAVEAHAAELLKQDKKNAAAGNPTQLCRQYLTQYTADFYRASAMKWLELRNQFWSDLKLSF